MKNKLLAPLESLPYFTIEAVRQLLDAEPLAAGTVRTALYRWMKSGRIIQIKKGVYMTRRFYELHRADADFAPAVSAILIPQSYLSLEYILQRNAILTGFAIFITYAFVLVAMGHVANVSYVVAFRQLSIPLGVLFGIGFLKEPAHAPKLIGAAIMLTGLLLVALG